MLITLLQYFCLCSVFTEGTLKKVNPLFLLEAEGIKIAHFSPGMVRSISNNNTNKGKHRLPKTFFKLSVYNRRFQGDLNSLRTIGFC